MKPRSEITPRSRTKVRGIGGVRMADMMAGWRCRVVDVLRAGYGCGVLEREVVEVGVSGGRSARTGNHVDMSKIDTEAVNQSAPRRQLSDWPGRGRKLVGGAPGCDVASSRCRADQSRCKAV